MTGSTRRIRWTVPVLGALLLTAACAQDPDPATTAAGPGPSGSHSGHSAPPSPAPLRADEHFLNLTMPAAYTPKAPTGGTDEYRCFLVDPKLTSAGYLTGSQFLPQNVAIVHHAIFFRIAPTDVDAARQLDERTPGQGWTCFGDAGVADRSAWVASWAPGSNETLLAPGLGYPMPPGSQLIMQVHYNLLAVNASTGATDQSGIRLRLTGQSAGMTALQTRLLPAPVELPCAPGESGPLCDRGAAITDLTHRFGDHALSTVSDLAKMCTGGAAPPAGSTQHCDQPAARSGTIYAVAGHMHLLGSSIRIDPNPGPASARPLLAVPPYPFDEQAIRPLATPVQVTTSDTFRVTCTHDATLRAGNPQLQQLPPRYVVWGEGTSDEMCLGLVIWSPSTT